MDIRAPWLPDNTRLSDKERLERKMNEKEKRTARVKTMPQPVQRVHSYHLTEGK